MKPLPFYLLLTTIVHITFLGIGCAQAIQKLDIISPQSQHVHGSTLVELSNGDLLVAWFQGSGERQADDVKIMGARLNTAAEKWSAPFVMADVPEFPDINPVLFVDQTNKLWLVWYTVLANQWETSLLKYRWSTDYLSEGPPNWDWQEVIHVNPVNTGGRGIQPDDSFVQEVAQQFETNWEYLSAGPLATLKPDELIAMKSKFDQRVAEILFLAAGKDWVRKGTIDSAGHKVNTKLGYPRFRRLGWQTRHKPLQLANGRIILPLYSDGFDFSLMAITDDYGIHWDFSKPLVSLGGVQPALLLANDQTIHSYMRDNGPPPQKLLYSQSKDQGVNWSPVVDSKVTNPGSGADAVVLEDGSWLIIGNDTNDGRHQLSLYRSTDEGQSWKHLFYLEKGPPKQIRAHYPAIIQGKDGMVRVTYTYQNKNDEGLDLKTIRFAMFNPADWN